ncbi:MAG: sodium:alanine symporter family protein [Oscillibacter sp.]|nr:sodium:alanine symporter family protein [Oscillibacter sp.]
MLLKLVQSVNACLTDYILILSLVGIGVRCSVKTRFVQVRCLREGLRRVLDGAREQGVPQAHGMTPFRAFLSAFAAQIGAGNLVGAAGAILFGGPGAVFWLWVISFFGMATAYAETVLALQTRPKARERHYQGGPVYYITAAFDGERGEKLANLYAFGAVLALGFFGAMTQSNAIGAAFRYAFGVPPWLTGAALAGVCAAAFLGGFRRIAAAMEKLAPVAAGLFLCAGVVILLARIAYLPAAVWMIFRYAFAPSAIIGGGYGAALKIAVSQGAKRGLFSNEAGLGSLSHAHAQANATPHEQGAMAMAGVFLDTFVLLTLNALVIVSALYTKGGLLEHGYTGSALQTLSQTNLTQAAFGTVFGGGFGAAFVALCLSVFALSTILNWNLFGRLNVIYLFGRDSNTAYTCAALAFVFLGALASPEFVWELSDLCAAPTVLPNAAALFALTGNVVQASRDANGQPPQ